jgi:hypothetical protein
VETADEGTGAVPTKPTKTPEQKRVDTATEKLSEEECIKYVNQNVELGKLMVLSQLEREFRGIAGSCFSRGSSDDEAKWYRNWADELKDRHDKLCKEYDKKYHPEFLK